MLLLFDILDLEDTSILLCKKSTTASTYKPNSQQNTIFLQPYTYCFELYPPTSFCAHLIALPCGASFRNLCVGMTSCTGWVLSSSCILSVTIIIPIIISIIISRILSWWKVISIFLGIFSCSYIDMLLKSSGVEVQILCCLKSFSRPHNFRY